MMIALVVLREVLEAMLIISVVLAASKGVAKRGWFVAGGVGLGVIGAFVVAFFVSQLSGAFAGHGQEFFQAAIMFMVTLLIGWHVVWMQHHGREMVAEMKQMGAAVSSGRKPLLVLALVVALAVWREGSEVVLFIEGFLAGQPVASVAFGSALGIAAGVGLGSLLYLGLLRLKMSTMFSTTNLLMACIAAGMAARGAGKLIETGILPPLVEPVWDTSAVLPEQSLPGQFVASLTGYIAQPSAMQLLFYVFTLATLAVLLHRQKRRHASSQAAQPIAQ